MTGTASTEASATSSIGIARDDVKLVAYWLSLGAASGGLGGALIGGLGGRIAMFILRLTSDASVRGLQSDDGFTIGRFRFFDTAQLILVTAVMGAIVGLLVVAGRPFFPRRGMPLAWGLAGAVTGGASLIHRDGVDFTALEPRWLAVGFFVAIPAAGAAFIAWLTEVYPRFWWRSRGTTAFMALPALPSVIFFPVTIAALLVGACWWTAMRSAWLRETPGWRPARVAAIVVFALVVALGAVDLVGDARAIVTAPPRLDKT